MAKIFSNSVTLCFGYYNSKDPVLKKMNIAAALDWIPVIGSIIAGCIRVNHISKHSRGNDTLMKATQITRATGEFLGLGLLFAITDVIVHIGRKIENRKSLILEN